METAEFSSQGEVLVVEDTPASLKLLTDLLRADGYTVRQAPDGELALWSAQSRPPELILLDVRMPGIDGFEVCRRLKASPQLASIPVIFLSAQYDTDDKVRGFQVGAVDFIGKPYQSEEVLARTRVHISLARAQHALRNANAELSSTLAQLRTARDEIVRSERLAALGAMVAGVAHELNTPIGNSVLAASTLAARTEEFTQHVSSGLRRSELDNFVADASQASSLMLRNLNKASELISSFKQVAAAQTNSQRSRFDLAQLVIDMAATMQPSFIESKVTLQVDAEPGISMDTFPGALCQIISQIGFNALFHAFGDGAAGTISIKARRDGEQHVLLTLSDSGSGIAAEHQSKIFDPFFTTRLGQGSSGLGLNIVHGLVTNVLGGTISVHSVPGDTCFTLQFPCNAPVLGHADGASAT
jgi:signal transduction histidine kinase